MTDQITGTQAAHNRHTSGFPIISSKKNRHLFVYKNASLTLTEMQLQTHFGSAGIKKIITVPDYKLPFFSAEKKNNENGYAKKHKGTMPACGLNYNCITLKIVRL